MHVRKVHVCHPLIRWWTMWNHLFCNACSSPTTSVWVRIRLPTNLEAFWSTWMCECTRRRGMVSVRFLHDGVICHLQSITVLSCKCCATLVFLRQGKVCRIFFCGTVLVCPVHPVLLHCLLHNTQPHCYCHC